MRKISIIALYTLLFWILIPGFMIWTSYRLNTNPCLARIRFDPSILWGIILSMISFPLLLVSIGQYFRFSRELPVSAYPPKQLMRRGLYNYWRHPIYLFYIAAFTGIALLMKDLALLICVMPVFIICTLVYIHIEEKILTRRFGSSYTYYKKQTGLVVPVIYQLLRYPVLLIAKIAFRYRSVNRGLIPHSPPYFIISVHKSYLDSFLIELSVPHPVSNLATSEVFRKPLLRWFMHRLFCISKKRFKADYPSVKHMLEVLDNDGAMGLFPEGERSWTGEFLGFKPEAMKLLLKKSGIPILPVRIEGNYAAWPRWSRRINRYKLTVEFMEPFYPDSESTPEELEKNILERIGRIDSTPEIIQRKEVAIADGLDKVFYRCPECSGFNTFVANGNILKCNRCGLGLQLSCDLIVSFNYKGSPVNMTIGEFYRTIMVTPEDHMFKRMKAESDELTGADEIIVDLQESGKCRLLIDNGNHFDHIMNGTLLLGRKSIVFKNDTGKRCLRYEDISSSTTESNYKLHLYDCANDSLYECVFSNASVLQWQDIIVSSVYIKTGRFINRR